MGGLRGFLTCVALLACGVVFSDAQAQTVTQSGGGGGGWDAVTSFCGSISCGPTSYHAIVGLGSGLGVAQGKDQGTLSADNASDTCSGTVSETNPQVSTSTVQTTTSYGLSLAYHCTHNGSGTQNGGALSETVCNSPYFFNSDYTTPACVATCPNGLTPVNGSCAQTCQQPTGTPDPELSLPGDVQGQPSCMQNCVVAYEGKFVINVGNPSQTGGYGSWAVQGPPGGMGNSCSANDTTHTSATPDSHGNDCVGDVCLNFPANSICDETGACVGLSGIPPSGCSQTPGGNMFCTSDAPTPPAPDNGTPGDKAPADGTANGSGSVCPNGETTCSFNYSNSSTTHNSTTNSGSSSGGSGGGGSGSSGGSGAGASSGSSGGASSSGSGGGGACDASKSKCGTGGSDPFSGPGGDSKSFQQSMSDFQTQVGTAPLATALNGLGDAAPDGGTLPSGTFTMFNHSYTLAPPQQVVDAVQPVLQVVMRCVWLLIGTFYFFRR